MRGSLETFDLNNYPLWTALITPLTADGEIDRPSLKNLIRSQTSAGNALLLLGSTGESLAMNRDDKMRVLSIAFEENSSVPVMVGLGGINLPETLKWMEYLEKLPIHAYLAVVPPYARPGSVGQQEWFHSLLEASSRPAMLYNVPSRTGAALSPHALSSLASHPRMWALKEAGGTRKSFRSYTRAAPSIAFYSGDDPLLPSYIPLGAKGLISVASNVWPKETHRYCQRALQQDLSPEEQELWRECTSELFHSGNPVTIKHLLVEIGRISSPLCLPPLSHRETIQTDQLMEAHLKIQSWYQTEDIS